MKKLTVLLILVLVIVYLSTAMSEEPFSVHGVSFGMNLEEVQSVLSDVEIIKMSNQVYIQDNTVAFSKFMSNNRFVCILVNNCVVGMFYGHECKDQETALSDGEYLENALTQKYGEYKEPEELFYSRLKDIFGVNAAFLKAWEINDVFISVLIGEVGVAVIYMPKYVAQDYNTFGL